MRRFACGRWSDSFRVPASDPDFNFYRIDPRLCVVKTEIVGTGGEVSCGRPVRGRKDAGRQLRPLITIGICAKTPNSALKNCKKIKNSDK